MEADSMYHGLKGVKLDLGCGVQWSDYKEKHGFEGMDLYDFGQKYVCDIRKELKTFKDKSVDAIRSAHFFEHLTTDEAVQVLNECHRILKPGHYIHIIVPHVTKHEGAFVLTHRSYWNEATFKDLSRPNRQYNYNISRWDLGNAITNNRGEVHAYLTPAYEEKSDKKIERTP